MTNRRTDPVRFVLACALCLAFVLALALSASAQTKLPGGVSFRLKEAGRTLDGGERAMNSTGVASTEWKIESAQNAVRGAKEKMKEIEEKFAGQYSPDHPDIAAMNKRIADLESKIQGVSADKQKSESEAQKAAAEVGAASADWLARLKPYVNPIGRPDHDPAKYLIPSATQEKAEMEKRLGIYAEASAALAEYGRSGAGGRASAELKQVVGNLEKAVKDFSDSCASYAARDMDEAAEQIAGLETFVKEQEAKVGGKEPVLFPQKDQIVSIGEVLDRAAVLVKPDNARLAGLRSRLEGLKQADLKLRAARKADTRMSPDKYSGDDIQKLKKAAEAFVVKENTDAKVLKTTIISSGWKEESVVEWTDTTQTAIRHRTTRSVTAQVGTKKGSDAVLHTVDVSQDRKSDGSWGEIYGHVMFKDPILEENIK